MAACPLLSSQGTAMDFELFVALFCVIGIGWLTLVPTYRGWNHLERRMAEQVETTIAALDDQPKS
jgi:hypothetical protein